MYGVVLWSDPAVATAVIWCEDHGDLAFYKVPEIPRIQPGFFLDAGDYVEFEIEVVDDMRKVVNARSVDAGYYPTIADALTSTVPANAPTPGFVDRPIESGNVVHMPRMRARSVNA